MRDELYIKDGALYVAGFIDFENVAQICAAGKVLIESKKIEKINLSHIDPKDSSSLALLTSWVRFSKKINQPIEIHEMPDFLWDLVRVSGLDTILPINFPNSKH